MSNTERFYPAPPAPGSAPVPAPADTPSASRQRIEASEVGESSSPASGVFAPRTGDGTYKDPWDDLSELERSFLALPSEEPTPRFVMGAAALAEMEAAAVPVRQRPTPAPVVAARLREDRLRDTAPARRDIVVVRKRAVTPDGFELAAHVGKPTAARTARSDIWQRALPWIAALGVLSGGAVFIQGQLQLVRRIRAAIPSTELQVHAPRPGASPVTSSPAREAPSAAPRLGDELATESEPSEQPPSVSPPTAVGSPVPSSTVPVGEPALAEPAQEAAPMADKFKPRSTGGVTNNVSLRAAPARRPALPNKKSSWLDTPISPPED